MSATDIRTATDDEVGVVKPPQQDKSTIIEKKDPKSDLPTENKEDTKAIIEKIIKEEVEKRDKEEQKDQIVKVDDD